MSNPSITNRKVPGASQNCQSESISTSIQNSSSTKLPNLSIVSQKESAEDDLHRESDPERCETHKKRLKYICWDHKEKICQECVIFGKHRNYECSIRHLKELNQVVGPAKTYCEELLPKITIFYEKAEKCYEEQRRSTLEIVQKRYSELRFILNAKEAEFIYEINSFHKKELDKLRSQVGENSLARQIITDKILEYEQITQNPQPFELLEENLEGTFKLIQTAVNPEMITETEQMLQQIEQGIDQTLSAQLSALAKMKITTKNDIIWMPEEADLKLDEELSLKQEFEKYNLGSTVLDPAAIEEKDIHIEENNLSISFPFQKSRERDLDALNDIDMDIGSLTLKIHQSIQRVNREDILSLCYIRKKLANAMNIKVEIQKDCEISDEALFDIFSGIFFQNKSLQHIFLISYADGCFDKSIMFLAESVLSSTENLKAFAIIFRKCQVSSKIYDSLCQSISNIAYGLTDFRFCLNCKDLNSSSWQNLFVRMPNLAIFACQMPSNSVHDSALTHFFSNTLPSFQKLRWFFLLVQNSSITDLSVKILFETFPREWFSTLTHLHIDLSNTNITNESIKHFVNEALPQFKVLESFSLDASGTQVTPDMKHKISQGLKK